MIRFSCPGCQAVYTVGPEKAGKTGKCPKCQSQFSIPTADGAGMNAPAPAPAPAPSAGTGPKPVVDPDAPVEIAGCPSCGTALTVATQYLGMDVECPTCKNVFTAKLPGATKPKTSTSTALARSEAPADDDEDDRPSKKKSKRTDDDEEDDRPSKKKSKRAEADEDDEPPRKSKRRDDDEDDRPKKKKKKGRSNVESKRTTAALLALLFGGWGVHKFYLGYTTAGIINICCCFGGFGIIPLIEGIIYLTKTDEDFIETYQIGEKQWF